MEYASTLPAVAKYRGGKSWGTHLQLLPELNATNTMQKLVAVASDEK